MIPLEELRCQAYAFRFSCRNVKGKTKFNGILGPEFVGCCGTGMQPLMMRCPQVKNTLFLVGPQIAITHHNLQIALDRIAGKQQFIYGTGNQQVFVFKTRNNAITKWLELCQKVLDYNQQEQEEVARLRQEAEHSDTETQIAATLALGLDH